MKTYPLFRLLKQSGLYALGNVAIKVSGLLLAPFLLDPTYLSLAEYGQLGVLLIFAQLIIQIGGLGLGTGLLKFVGKEKLKESRYSSAFTALITSMVSGIFFYFMVRWSSGLFSGPLVGQGQSGSMILNYLGIYIGFKIVGTIPLMVIRIQERAGVYASTVILEMITLFGVTYYLLVISKLGLEGIILAYSIASGVSVSVITTLVILKVKWQFDFKLINSLIRYGIPLVFVGLAGIILNAGDRFILKALTGDEEVGMYEWAARMSGVLNLFVVQSFQLAFTVIGLKALGEGNDDFHKRIFRHYVVWAGWAALGISVLSYELTLLLNGLGASEHYLKSTEFVFPLAIGTMVYGVFIVINNVLYSSSKTTLISRNVIISALVNVLLNFALVPQWGAGGAAFSTLLSYAFLLGLTWMSARREHMIDYSWEVLIKILGLLTVLYFLAQSVVMSFPNNAHAIRILILFAYPLLAIILKIYRTEELRLGLKLVFDYFKR